MKKIHLSVYPFPGHCKKRDRAGMENVAFIGTPFSRSLYTTIGLGCKVLHLSVHPFPGHCIQQ